MKRALALVLLLAGPLAAQDFDVHDLYEKWKAEECRTLEGWRVLDDDTLIERLGPVSSRWRDGVLIAASVSNPEADALLAVACFHGVGGAPRDWLVARHLAASARRGKLPEAGYICVRQLASIGTQDDALVVDVSGIDLTKAVRDRLTVEGFAAADYLLALLELESESTRAAGRDRLLAAANAGCLPAMVSEARRMQVELGTTPENAKWLETAAEADYVPALVEIGNWFHYHGGTMPDLKRCREAFQRAADLGSAYAMQQLGRLPEKPLEEMTIAELFARYIACWGDTTEVEVTLDDGPARFCAGTSNPELARYPELAYWLSPHANPVIEQAVGAEELRQARTMYGECFMRGTGGVGQNLDVAYNWLARAQNDRNGPASLLLHDYHLIDDPHPTLLSSYLHDAIDAGFAPALRIQAKHTLKAGELGYQLFDLDKPETNYKQTQPEALSLLHGLAKGGDVYAMRALYGHYRPTGDDDSKWLFWLNTAADADDPQAWLELAVAYDTGSGVAQDAALAEEWYAKALHSLSARQQAQAWFERKRVQATLPRLESFLLEWEQTLNKHADVAPLLDTPWHVAGYAQRAHGQGFEAGTAAYGLCLLYGVNVAADKPEGRRLLVQVSANACAAYEVARLTEDEPNVRYAVGILTALASDGTIYAAYRLGVIHTEEAAYLDHGKAFEYFQQAAEGGCIPAMVGLANAYKQGLGVEADATAAQDWAQKAADEGDETAKTLLEEWK